VKSKIPPKDIPAGFFFFTLKQIHCTFSASPRHSALGTKGTQLPEILQDVSPLTLTWATDQNFIEFHKQMACLPGAEVHDEADLMWFATPIKMGGFNGVVRASLKPEDVGQKVAEVTELFRQRDTSWSWGVGPTSQPSDLGRRLEEHGMTVGGQELAMAADLHALKAEAGGSDHRAGARRRRARRLHARDGHRLRPAGGLQPQVARCL
jgi:hypothetical protein